MHRRAIITTYSHHQTTKPGCSINEITALLVPYHRRRTPAHKAALAYISNPNRNEYAAIFQYQGTTAHPKAGAISYLKIRFFSLGGIVVWEPLGKIKLRMQQYFNTKGTTAHPRAGATSYLKILFFSWRHGRLGTSGKLEIPLSELPDGSLPRREGKVI